jgi:hypothetical protein
LQQRTIKIHDTSYVISWCIGNLGHKFDSIVHRWANSTKVNCDKPNKHNHWDQELSWIWRGWQQNQYTTVLCTLIMNAHTFTNIIYEHSPQFLSSEPSGQSTMKSHHRDFATHCPLSKHFLLPSGHSISSVRRKFWHLLWQQQIIILSTVKLEKYFLN